MPIYQQYIRWLRAAYLYYISAGEDSGMTDAEWDMWSRHFHAKRADLPADQYPVLHREEFTGGSLFWLKASEYPEEAKRPVSYSKTINGCD